jgi:AcrR family transcriptional regulator
MELYGERGFDETSVADIAARAGVTERTFFRYFADKREVLFEGSREVQTRIVAAIAAAPEDADPLEAAMGGVEVVGTILTDRDHSRLRNALIEANPSLMEREQLKMATLRTAAATALRGRGATELTASVAADAAVSAFGIGFRRWIDGDDEDLATAIRSVAAELRRLVR